MLKNIQFYSLVEYMVPDTDTKNTFSIYALFSNLVSHALSQTHVRLLCT